MQKPLTKPVIHSPEASLDLEGLRGVIQLAVAQTIKSVVRRAAKEVAAKQLDKDSPHQEILTPEGCRALLHIGEKALCQFHKDDPPIPHVETSNSYRYPRSDVLKWLSERARLAKPRPSRNY